MLDPSYDRFIALRPFLPSFFAAYHNHPGGQPFIGDWEPFDTNKIKYLELKDARKLIEKWQLWSVGILLTSLLVISTTIALLWGGWWCFISFFGIGIALVLINAVFEDMKENNTAEMKEVCGLFDSLYQEIKKIADLLGKEILPTLAIKTHDEIENIAHGRIITAMSEVQELQSKLETLTRSSEVAEILEIGSKKKSVEQKTRDLFKELQKRKMISTKHTYDSLWDIVLNGNMVATR